MTAKKGTWTAVKREETGGMRSELERIGGRYISTVLEWQEPDAFAELTLTVLVAAVLRGGTTRAAGEN